MRNVTNIRHALPLPAEVGAATGKLDDALVQAIRRKGCRPASRPRCVSCSMGMRTIKPESW